MPETCAGWLTDARILGPNRGPNIYWYDTKTQPINLMMCYGIPVDIPIITAEILLSYFLTRTYIKIICMFVVLLAIA